MTGHWNEVVCEKKLAKEDGRSEVDPENVELCSDAAVD